MNRELIERLKKNTKVWCDLSDEEKACFREVKDLVYHDSVVGVFKKFDFCYDSIEPSDFTLLRITENYQLPEEEIFKWLAIYPDGCQTPFYATEGDATKAAKVTLSDKYVKVGPAPDIIVKAMRGE